MPEDFDAIVVGAGPAGSVAAMTMAEQGMSVLLLERGKYPGAKNMFGGTIYSQATAEIFPEFWQEAPVERPVATDSLWIMDVDSAVQITYAGLQYLKSPYNKFTAIRSKFDQWLANRAVQAGAELRTGSYVTRCLTVGRRVTGVALADGQVINAGVVILADGVMSSLAQQLGLRGTIHPSSVTLYVKEIIELPPETIESRFQLEPGAGAVYGVVGYPTAGAVGKAGIWTNKSTVSLIVGGYLSDIISKRLRPLDLLIRFKQHPFVSRLIAGGKTVEYLAHMIPKGGYEDMPKLYSDGVMVVGDAAVMVSGRHGTDLAMLTGKYAGETAAMAKANNDYSARSLAAYQKKVEASWFMKDIRAGRVHKSYYFAHPDSDYLLSIAANKAANRYFDETPMSNTERKKLVLDELLKIQPLPKTLDDLYDGLLHWRFM